jgi:hypothetical protein
MVTSIELMARQRVLVREERMGQPEAPCEPTRTI